MVLSPGENVVGCVCVAEESVRYVLPNPGVRLVLRHHVMQVVVQLLIRGRGPGENNFAVDCLFDLHWPGALGLIWKRILRGILSSVLNINDRILGVEVWSELWFC